MTDKFSPGPWTYDGPPHNIIVWCGPDHRVAFIMTSDGPAEANARLIAAAPDLVEALEWAMSKIGEPRLIRGQNDTQYERWQFARAALTKAGAA